MAAIIASREPRLSRPPRSPQVVDIDAKSVTIHYKVVTSLFYDPKGTQQQLIVPFIPPLKDSQDARKRFVELTKEARLNGRQVIVCCAYLPVIPSLTGTLSFPSSSLYLEISSRQY